MPIYDVDRKGQQINVLNSVDNTVDVSKALGGKGMVITVVVSSNDGVLNTSYTIQVQRLSKLQNCWEGGGATWL